MVERKFQTDNVSESSNLEVAEEFFTRLDYELNALINTQ